MDQAEHDFLESVGLSVINTIAKGGFGAIYLVFSHQYKSNFALKRIHYSQFNESEVKCLQSFYDPNIVNLYHYYKFEKYVYLLMEYCPFDLNKLMMEKPQFTDEELYKYSLDILHAVKACHDCNVAHSDIKPSNFLIDKYGRVKISDFGLSTVVESKQVCHLFKGTRMFMAPEIFSQDSYNPIIADVWAIGVTLYFMATRMYPFYSPDQYSLQRMIEAGIYAEDEVQDLLLRKVIFRCLEVNVHRRATIAELLEMPYFKQYKHEYIPPSSSYVKPSTLIVKPRVKENMLLNKSQFGCHRGSSRVHISSVPATGSI